MSETEIARLRRKANQHYEMAGLARADQDQADNLRHLRQAKIYDAQIKKLESQQ
jgi:hypothetical protein